MNDTPDWAKPYQTPEMEARAQESEKRINTMASEMADVFLFDNEIYQRFYKTAQANMVWTLWAWIERDLPDDLEEPEKRIEEIQDEMFPAQRKLIQTILALEVSIWVFRRLNGPWGEVIDSHYETRAALVEKYEELSGGVPWKGNERFY